MSTSALADETKAAYGAPAVTPGQKQPSGKTTGMASIVYTE